MNLKDEMMKQYQNNKVFKTHDQVVGDIKIQMENGFNEIYYDEKVISDEVAEKFRAGGFKVENYEDKHTESQYLKMIKISWGSDESD